MNEEREKAAERLARADDAARVQRPNRNATNLDLRTDGDRRSVVRSGTDNGGQREADQAKD